ncbi:MAG: hypothetical protein ACK2TZ_09620 [Anaerolineales bacterium]
MSNPHAEWRIQFARRLTDRFTGYQDIQAIVVAGSVARGFTDEYSDLELPIFWDELPSDDTRLAIIEDLGGEFLNAYDGPSREDQLLIDGVQVDLWHVPRVYQEQVIEAVLAGERSDLSSLNALDTIRSCIPLFGQGIVQEWKKRAEAFPDVLALRIIQEHLPSFSLGELVLHAQRGNPTAYYSQLVHLQEEVFLVLLALNRCYFPTFKWLYHTLEKMTIKPKEIGNRFQQAFSESPEAAAANMKGILLETLDLVKETYPEIDVARDLRRLNYQRTAHPKEGPSGSTGKASEER